MIDASRLLKDLKRLLNTLEADVRARLDDNPEVRISLEQEWKDARAAGRTARTLEDWLDEEITQGAVHWILGIVFLRLIEDNGLVGRPWLSGPAERLALARDRYEAFFREHPTLCDREYLQSCFRDAEALPGVKALFDERHNPLWRLETSGDGAAALIQFCQRIDPDRGDLDHNFGGLDTRFLGDLYQDLSEAAKKRYALLQTPEFVERFILDRTLVPAIAEFGYRSVQLIDPACGSGHFIIDTFRRLFDLRARNEPNLPLPAAAQAALDQVAGVDINPFAVGIARFRLLAAALEACGSRGCGLHPISEINVATGDSLLHGRQFTQLDLKGDTYVSRDQGVRHVYATEDRDDLTKILGQQYHVVVGNPPYITPKDPGLNKAYRERYATCHMKYALVVPFVERFFDLAFSGDNGAGYIGMIVGNSFMKREFGKKLIEEFLPKLDLTHIVDTAGAYIPGHGIPTAILFGRQRDLLDGP